MEKANHPLLSESKGCLPLLDKSYKLGFVSSEDSDSCGHPISLIRLFTVCFWVAQLLSFLHADSEEFNLTWRMPRMI